MNILKLTAENPDELLTANAYGAGALIRVERSATGGGAGYAEIGTVALVSGTTLYTYYDQTAAAGNWYRTRYSNVGNTNLSAYSDEFQATVASSVYGSLYDVKQRLGIVPSNTANDEELLQYLIQAAAFMDNRMSRHIGPDSATTYTLDGFAATNRGRCLWVEHGIRTLTGITVGLTTSDTPVALATSFVFLRPLLAYRQPGAPATQLWLSDVAPYRIWPLGYGNIVLTGTFGWDDVPSELEAMALRLTVNAWRNRAAGGAESFMQGMEGQRVFEYLLSWEEKQTLESYNIEALAG